MANFQLQIVTQQKTVFDQEVTALTMPGEDGSFGVLARHAAIISVLKEGTVKLRTGQMVQELEIGGGFFEMENNKATLLVDWLKGLKNEGNEE
jgi:F-type H+-transporting ATPase subunit epsilon